MRQNYEFVEFNVKEYIELINMRSINLPKFQRDVVWTDNQKFEFAESLKRGLPFGVFLLALRDSSKSDATKYKLLDGFQRTNAIMEIYFHPQAFFNKSQINLDLLNDFKCLLVNNGASIPSPKNDSIADSIVRWVKNQKDLDTTKGFKAIYMFTDIAKEFSVEEVKN